MITLQNNTIIFEESGGLCVFLFIPYTFILSYCSQIELKSIAPTNDFKIALKIGFFDPNSIQRSRSHKLSLFKHPYPTYYIILPIIYIILYVD